MIAVEINQKLFRTWHGHGHKQGNEHGPGYVNGHGQGHEHGRGHGRGLGHGQGHKFFRKCLLSHNHLYYDIVITRCRVITALHMRNYM
jgi:hypothetical protein